MAQTIIEGNRRWVSVQLIFFFLFSLGFYRFLPSFCAQPLRLATRGGDDATRFAQQVVRHSTVHVQYSVQSILYVLLPTSMANCRNCSTSRLL